MHNDNITLADAIKLLHDAENRKKDKIRERLGNVKTKEEFGEAMHSSILDDEEKIKIAEAVEELGGYDALGD